ncbi:MAG TPA: hypothetical protein VGN63_15335 [Flavisolibacter sp.]|jgi:hypothetical protein|nr:hypothetical protein [Flavisolibacter sp.]
MPIKETIRTGVVATSVMTAFSYAVSAVEGENFKEPLLLSLFVKRLTAKQNKFLDASGWPLHYTLGCIWAGVYTSWTEGLLRKPSFRHMVLFGCFSGTLGVVIWRALFRHHPNPPQTNRQQFYQQLFIAHLLFTFSLAKTYRSSFDHRT